MNARSENNPAAKMDRRTRRTRQLLRDSLLALILEQGYDAVTVEEITERADLGRTTFYLHYKDKEDLLMKSIEAISNELLAQISNTPPILLVFRHAGENAVLYRIILRGEGARRATVWLQELISSAARNFLEMRAAQENLETRPSVPVEIFSNYFAGSLLGLVTWWLESNMPYPPEEMAEMFQKLFFQGARQVLGLPTPT
jgi:AcrR family transcriptional regulator